MARSPPRVPAGQTPPCTREATTASVVRKILSRDTRYSGQPYQRIPASHTLKAASTARRSFATLFDIPHHTALRYFLTYTLYRASNIAWQPPMQPIERARAVISEWRRDYNEARARLDAEFISAATAVTIGLASKVFSEESFADDTGAFLKSLSKRPLELGIEP